MVGLLLQNLNHSPQALRQPDDRHKRMEIASRERAQTIHIMTATPMKVLPCRRLQKMMNSTRVETLSNQSRSVKARSRTNSEPSSFPISQIGPLTRILRMLFAAGRCWTSSSGAMIAPPAYPLYTVHLRRNTTATSSAMISISTGSGYGRPNIPPCVRVL